MIRKFPTCKAFSIKYHKLNASAIMATRITRAYIKKDS